MEEDAFFDASTEASKPSTKTAPSAATPFDDDGEPDFAGWLAAQASKKPGGKPLPKGLAKPSNGRPVLASRAASTGGAGGAGAKKAAAPTKPVPKPAVGKKIDTAPKASGDDDGWGDGW
jgi:SCY1-like protein 1